MIRLPSKPIFLALPLVMILASTPVYAQSSGRQQGERNGGTPPARSHQNRQEGQEGQAHNHDRELSDAVRRVVREQRGRVLSAERVQYEGREVNRIKVIDDSGRVRVYVDDPHGNDSRETRGDSP